MKNFWDIWTGMSGIFTKEFEMKKLIKVFIILAVFLILAVWVGNVFAQEADQWDVVLDGPGSREAVFYPSRRLVYILALFIIIISVIF